jgi:hypothetical protein
VIHALRRKLPDDPSFTYYVVEEGYVVGEAKDVKPCECGNYLKFIRLIGMEQFAEYGMWRRKT